MSRAKRKATNSNNKAKNPSYHNKRAVHITTSDKNNMNSSPPLQGGDPGNNKNVVSFKPLHLLNRIAKHWRTFLVLLATTIFWAIVDILLGFNPIPQSSPLVTAIDQHPIASLVIGGILLAVTVASLILWLLPDSQTGGREWYVPRSVFSTGVPIISSTLFCVLLIVVLLRPTWCPAAICPAPQTILVFHQQDIHDNNLDLYFLAQQSASYTIPGNPANYTQNNLSTSIGALHTDGQKSESLYHLILGFQNLQQERFGMIIEEVDLVIQQIAPIPHPLNVWTKNPSIQYDNKNNYRVIYYGQVAGTVTPAIYLRYPGGFMHLNPGETDAIDLHVVSLIEANIFFSVQIIYRIDNESQLHTLQLPKIFEVMFANQLDWHPYRLK